MSFDSSQPGRKRVGAFHTIAQYIGMPERLQKHIGVIENLERMRVGVIEEIDGSPDNKSEHQPRNH